MPRARVHLDSAAGPTGKILPIVAQRLRNLAATLLKSCRQCCPHLVGHENRHHRRYSRGVRFGHQKWATLHVTCTVMKSRKCP
jgi:hypothetical protein